MKWMIAPPSGATWRKEGEVRGEGPVHCLTYQRWSLCPLGRGPIPPLFGFLCYPSSLFIPPPSHFCSFAFSFLGFVFVHSLDH
jgi:hypothetical protein